MVEQQEAVQVDHQDSVAVLRFGMPPGDALTPTVCDALSKSLTAADANPDVAAIVLVGRGPNFSAGHDIAHLDAASSQAISALTRQVENCGTPVIAALSGLALGTGFELALACHYRVADAQARIGFPDIGLGLLPCAGGTQRAPRLAGAEVALHLMLTGQPLQAGARPARPFFDELIKGDLIEGAQQYATGLIASGAGPRRSSQRSEGFADGAAYAEALKVWRGKAPHHPQSPNRDIIECVEAARLLPFEAGLDFEEMRFVSRVESLAFRGLRHVAVAERRAMQTPEGETGTAQTISQVGVIGLGGVGAGFAAACLIAGLKVVAVERGATALEQGEARIRTLLDLAVEKGRLSPVRRDGIEAELAVKSDLVAVAEADFVLEASGLDAAGERQVFAQLDGVTKEGAVLAAHGPAGRVAELAAETGCPEEVIGLYFPTAAHVSPGVEVAVGPESSADTVATTFAFLRSLGKAPVRVAALSGLVGQWINAAALRAAERLVLQGAHPYEIDAAMRDWGMSLGPFEAADLAGLDADWLLDADVMLCQTLVDLGRRGRSTGRGWYRYPPDAVKPEPSAEIERFVQQAHDGSARKVDAEEIQLRCLAAMANAGIELVRAKVVRGPSEIDVSMVHGFGFPRWRGGPMMAAQETGVLTIRNTLRAMRGEGDPLSTPDPVFDHLIKNGGHLTH